MSRPSPTKCAKGGMVKADVVLYVPAGKNNTLLALTSSWSVLSEYSSSKARCMAAVSSVELSPLASNALTETWSSKTCCNDLDTSPAAPVTIGVESPRYPLYTYDNAVVKAELPAVIISVFPTAGAPSATVPFPMYNFWSSIDQPNSPAANWGKSVFKPRLCCILDIWTIGILQLFIGE